MLSIRTFADSWLISPVLSIATAIPKACLVAPAAIGQKGRYVSVVETVVSLTEDQNEKKKPNKIWSEWQDLNLRPLRPERSALPG